MTTAFEQAASKRNDEGSIVARFDELNVTSICICAVIFITIGACRGPDEMPRRPKLHIQPELLTQQWQSGPRRDAAEAFVRRQGREFARALFLDEPMPKGMPSQRTGVVRASQTLLKAVDAEVRRARHEHPPEWWTGSPTEDGAYTHDLPKEYEFHVKRGETLGRIAKWSHRKVERLKEENSETLRGTRWLIPGMALKITMSPNQKMLFDQLREGFHKERLEAYFSKRYIEKVVVHIVQRNERIATVAQQHGKTPIWLLEEFNHTDFRSLQPGDTVLIPVVQDLRPGRRPPARLQVVDSHGMPLTKSEKEQLSQRLKIHIVAKARLAIDGPNVFERDLASSPKSSVAGIVPDPSFEPRVRVAVPPPINLKILHEQLAEPLVTSRTIIVKRGETLSHFSNWAGISQREISSVNGGVRAENLKAGQRLSLPLTDLAYADFVLARSGALARGRKAASVTKPEVVPKAVVPQIALQQAEPQRILTRIAPAAIDAKNHFPRPIHEKMVHIVKPGETASAIALKYHVSMGSLSGANPGRNLNRLYVGDRLGIPSQPAKTAQ